MAKKRRAGLRGLAGGLSGGASDVLGLILQSKLIGDRQNETADRMLTGQALDDVRERLKILVDPKYVAEVGPERATSAYDAAVGVLPERMRPLLGDRPDFGRLDSPVDERVGTLTKEISEITSPDDPRLTAEGLKKRAPGLRIPVQELRDISTTPGMGGFPIVTGGHLDDTDTIKALTQLGTRTREGLLAKEERDPITDYASGTATTRYRSNREQAGMAPVQAERTAMQEGQRAGTVEEQKAIGEERGLQATEAERTARTVREYEAMTPAEMARFAQQEGIRTANDLQLVRDTARIELETAGRAEEAKTLTRLTTDATVAMAGLKEMAALATEVNSGFTEGGMDVYAGIRQTFDSLPYIGRSVSDLMTALGATGTAIADQDPTIVRKIMRLQAMRREMAISMIRAAGDPRPSDVDVVGVLPSLPGPFESRQQTAEKIQFMHDRTLAIPDLIKENPGLKGRALLDAAAERAQTRAGGRAAIRPESETPATSMQTPGRLSPTAAGALEILNAR